LANNKSSISNTAAEKIFKLQTLSGWAFDIELLLLAKNLGYEIREVPITWKNDSNSHVRFSGMIKMLIDLVRINFLSNIKRSSN